MAANGPIAFANSFDHVQMPIGYHYRYCPIGRASACTRESSFLDSCVGRAGIVSGLAMYGYKVVATIGSEITQLTPSRGFAAQLATASTVVIASGFGLPISTTQTLVGAVLGVGLREVWVVELWLCAVLFRLLPHFTLGIKLAGVIFSPSHSNFCLFGGRLGLSNYTRFFGENLIPHKICSCS